MAESNAGAEEKDIRQRYITEIHIVAWRACCIEDYLATRMRWHLLTCRFGSLIRSQRLGAWYCRREASSATSKRHTFSGAVAGYRHGRGEASL